MKNLQKITAVFLIWRVALFLISVSADFFLTYNPSFPYADAILATSNLPRWLYSWGNFDGVHYLTIIAKGYHGADLIQAFFPIYPYFAKIVSLFIKNYFVSSFLISNFAFLIFLYLWYEFIAEGFSKKIAFWSSAVILLFPTSLFFGAIYTESLFLIFVVGSFWSVQKKHYLMTALCIALASATRITGILLLPAILFELVFNKIKWGDDINITKELLRKSISKWQQFIKPAFIVSLGFLGLLSYMIYLHLEFGDSLYFFHVQSEFGGIRQESLILYPQVVWRYMKILLISRPFDLKYYSYIQDLFAAIAGLLVILYSLKKVKLSYVLFALFAFFLPTFTGTFSSMPRYILVCFPLFILLGIWLNKSKKFRLIWFTLSGILLVLNTVLFVQGYWIA